MTFTGLSRYTRAGAACRTIGLLLAIAAALILAGVARAHPLGQFSVNHFSRIVVSPDSVKVRHVVDLAEIPTFQECQTADTDGSGSLSKKELDDYLGTVAGSYLDNLRLTVNSQPVTLSPVAKEIGLLPGQSGSDQMGLATMRMVFDLEGPLNFSGSALHFKFENLNQSDRAGWRELAVSPGEAVSIYDSSVYGNPVTNELRTYPEEMLMAPLDERRGEWAATIGPAPEGANPLRLRDGKPAAMVRDRFASLIAVPEITPGFLIMALLIAFGLGGIHALSPGHGKAIVGAYLVGSRGTARHAALLGLTVTITHTIGVFALGLVTLYASRYILPETLYPLLSFVSGAMVVAIGLSLFIRRLNSALGIDRHEHAHTHPPPEGNPLSPRNLIALGVSGGLMPCPSALVVLLASISLGRVGFGLVLIIAFSLGLAAVLTAIGLVFIYGGRFITLIPGSGGLMKYLPVLSSLVVVGLGLAICYQVIEGGFVLPDGFWETELETTGQTSAIAILGLGLLIGLRHALDTDHLAAVSTIVCERRNVFSSMIIGGIWGLGHTISLLIAGVGVILLNIRIEKYEKHLEFMVALMLIGLGANVLWKLLRGDMLHFHSHTHGELTHAHPHLHAEAGAHESGSHHGLRFGLRPLIIGMVHGLAGSAALMLAVLATIKSPSLAFAYIAVFGAGSVGGMMIMSLLLGLPALITARGFSRTNLAVRAFAGLFSLGFGLFLVYEIGFKEGLLR